MVGPVSNWYNVSFDDDAIYISTKVAGREDVNISIRWIDISKICFQTGSAFTSDEALIFIKDRRESYIIPSEANGASDLWGEIIERKLFDAELAIKAASAQEGELFCWPQETQNTHSD